MADERMYILQPSFAAGEISPDVANRVDLDKYRSAVLQAKNFFIRPYGSAYRRPGMEHVAVMYGTGRVRLKEFGISESASYLLAFRAGYVDVYLGGTLKATVATPYTADEIPALRFAQSAANMFIAHPNHPVQVLKYSGDTSWSISEFVPNPGYIDENTYIEGETITPSHRSGSNRTLTYSGSENLFTNQVGNWVRIKQAVKVSTKELNINVEQNAVAKETTVIDAQAVTWSVTSSGTWTGSLKVEYSSDNENWNTLRTYSSKDDFNVSETGRFSHTTYVRLSGNVSMGSLSATLTVNNSPDTATRTLSISVPSSAVTNQTSGMIAGLPGWKIVTHGTWTGSFEIQQSEDNSTWETLRTYSSKDDFNVTETGTFDDLTYIRLVGTIRKGNFAATLTRLSYDNTGLARITAVTDGQHCTVRIYKKFAYAEPADNWALGSWSAAYGYPSAIAFFQDRLCLAGSKQYPYMVWMSRTGDYWNFDVEEANGEVLDDSAVALAFISRRDYKIKHLVAFTDLIVMTEGNEWIVSGNETVTPKQVTPKMQTSRGCTDVEPEFIGGQIVYVQKGGRTVRDMQYSYTTDSYDGMDLTLLAKHLTLDATITSSAYKQEPDSMLVYVLSNGTAICLTYINDQKVYAWSRITTDGTIMAVETVNTASGSELYFVVDRTNGRHLERLHEMGRSDVPDDYIMLDSAKKGTYTTASNTITAGWLADQQVDVLADGEHISNLTADGMGMVTLEVPCKKYVIGLRYNSTLEIPNIELQLNDGTMQGRKKKVSSAILRLDRSLGGKIGMTADKLDIIKYDELMAQEVKLYSGEKNVTVPNVAIGGFNNWGRLVLYSSYPYPLSVASIVRVVVPGG